MKLSAELVLLSNVYLFLLNWFYEVKNLPTLESSRVDSTELFLLSSPYTSNKFNGLPLAITGFKLALVIDWTDSFYMGYVRVTLLTSSCVSAGRFL